MYSIEEAKDLVHGLCQEEWYPRRFVGMGAFGAVFRTYDPGVALKITSDFSEAKLAHRLRHFKKDPPGIVRVYKLRTLQKVDRWGEGLWAIWREYARLSSYLPRGAANAIREYIEDCEYRGPVEESINMITEYKRGRVLGRTLKEFLDRGIFFADLRKDNMGIVKRRGKDAWVITDFGCWSSY